jgi:outer membrane protein TolC
MCIDVLALATCLAAAEPAGAGLEHGLDREAGLEQILELALRRNPDLADAGERAAAAESRANAASRLPDLELKVEQWGTPLDRPFDFGATEIVMIGLRQAFPAWGTRSAGARAADREAELAREARRARVDELKSRVRHAWFDYYRADRELRIHREHEVLAQNALSLTRAQYQAGRGSQQDVLRAQVEMARLHNDLADIEQARRSNQVLLNTLMARAPDAPLGPPPEPVLPKGALGVAEAEPLLERRPEVASAAVAVGRSEALVDAARGAAWWPTFMVGLDYMGMRAMELGHPGEAATQEREHSYGAMVTVSLPWINPLHRDRLRESERSLAADRHALESARANLRFELRDAAARLDAARRSLAVIEGELLTQARQSYEAARAAFSAGQGTALGLLDALRSYLQVRIEHGRALARVGTSLADYERVVGSEASGRKGS